MNSLHNHKLGFLGWRESFEEAFQPYQAEGLSPGRITSEAKGLYRVYTEFGEIWGEVTGKLRHQATGRDDYPAVGDWVAIAIRKEEARGTINAVLPRFSKFSRKTAGVKTVEQIVAANVDTVFLVAALNQDFNPRRLERYLVLAWESGSNPVIVLSKSDLCVNIAEAVSQTEAVAVGVPIHIVSSYLDNGVEALSQYLGAGNTVALLGSSGAGKSTLANKLFGEEILETGHIREEDGKGRHTTTSRELVVLPGGGLLIDTPGMRELQLWEADDGLSASFADVETFAADCRFHDCGHGKEPGCAVQEALRSGELDAARFESYLKLQRELAYLARKEDVRLRLDEKTKWKKLNQQMKQKPLRP